MENGELKMKKLLLILSLFAMPVMGRADLLSELLKGEYNAKTLSVSEQDSILALELAKSKLDKNHRQDACAPQERYQLEYENKTGLFRHSFVADWYLVDNEKGTRTHLSEGKVRDAQLSPNGKYVVYAKGNNLYIYKTDFHTEIAVTQDENPEIINGVADWLYEEEFAATALFAFSPDSKLLAYVRLDETEVPTFCWQNMFSADEQPLRYPADECLRYPKAGDRNASASVRVYDIVYKGVKTMQTGDLEDGYLPRIQWRGEELLIEKMNRDQNRLEILSGNPKTTVCHTLYREKSDKYYVDYSLFDQWQWLADGRFVVLSEKSGWMAAYLYSADGMELKQLTPDGMDVTKLYGVDEKAGKLYYQAAVTPMERQAFVMELKKGTIKRLTTEAGTHDLRFAEDMKTYIDCYQSVETPNCYRLCSADGKLIRTLLDNEELRSRWEALELPKTEFCRIPTERGDTLNAYTIMPRNMEAGKKYPVILIQYSGPGSQRVLNRWRKRWGTYLATQGFIVVDADGRGTACRGRKWCNETYMSLGQKEAEDQISVARYMGAQPYADAARIAMVGWSYGGFQTIRTMSEADSPIKCGIAIAPVTDWRLYDSAYTERYMRRPEVNEFGYDNADLCRMADKLNGKLLIVHGLTDDNVHAQNTLLYIDALVKAGKQFEMQLYPDDNHFLRRRANYEHLHRRLMLFLNENL